MKRLLFYSFILVLALTSCSTRQMPPFSSSQWALEGNVAVSSSYGMAVDFGGRSSSIITNASNGGYDLNFICSDVQWADYDVFCKHYITSVLRKIPLAVDSVGFVLADQFLMVEPNASQVWLPDMVRQSDGTELITKVFPPSSMVQPDDEIWRNVLFDNSLRRIIIVDRLVRGGRPLALVYLLQGETKRVPFSSVFHYDVTDRRYTQQVGEHMRYLLDISIDASQSQFTPQSYNSLVHRADSCYMAGDFAGASAYFDRAFAAGEPVQGFHIYNAACAASRAGLADVAFQRLDNRLSLEPDWYVDDPYADQDLVALHQNARWQSYVDTMSTRRERIEANYDKPLRARLMDIAQSDQDIRHRFLNAYYAEPRNQALIDSLLSEMQRIDSVNQVRICDILDTRGFVGSDRVGGACATFWLVIQHAPLELQKKYFTLFEQAAMRGDLSKENVAMMDDRIAMFEGRPQKYGSQIVDGAVYELLDADKVDLWRQEMGMQPLDDYLLQMGAHR